MPPLPRGRFADREVKPAASVKIGAEPVVERRVHSRLDNARSPAASRRQRGRQIAAANGVTVAYGNGFPPIGMRGERSPRSAKLATGNAACDCGPVWQPAQWVFHFGPVYRVQRTHWARTSRSAALNSAGLSSWGKWPAFSIIVTVSPGVFVAAVLIARTGTSAAANFNSAAASTFT